MKNPKIDANKIKLAKDISKALSENKQPQKNVDLPPDKLSKIMNMLNDEATMKKIMESEDAKALLEKFGKE